MSRQAGKIAAKLPQSFAKQNSPLHNLKPKRFMNAQRQRVVDPRVRSHLHATLPTRPSLRRLQQLFANPVAPLRLRDVPPFHVTDRARRIAMIRMRPQPGFKETKQRLIRRLRNKDHLRQSAGCIPCENRFEFKPMLLGGRFRPKRVTQARQRISIRGLRTSNPDTGAQNKPHRFFAFSRTL